MARDFLVELGTEELPPTALKGLMQAFASGIERGLQERSLGCEAVEPYATPRRLAVVVRSLDEVTATREQVIWGPPARIAFDDEGKPTRAAQAFAAKNGIELSDLQTDSDGKAEKLVYRSSAGGEPAATLLPAIVDSALAALPIPKRMRWGARREEFVRPVHWLVMLLGDEIVDAEILGLRASRETRGHRFHYDQPLLVENADDYLQKMPETAYVVVDFHRRRQLIREQVEAEADKVGGVAVLDNDLLDEVTALVEWPVALTGRFEQRFLEVPSEALIYSMKEHQKYFPVVDTKGTLLPFFVTVANLESRDPSCVIEGNERVIRPRLADAAFFFETDRKTSLKEFRERLKTIVFQAKLGSLYDKTERIRVLAERLAGQIDGNRDYAITAAELCKSDLVSDMVGEFDKMQGLAGYYYARHEGYDSEIAEAIREHYRPRYAGDQLPDTTTGTLLAIADRVDTLTGIFGIGERPSGSKDPFALRRASLGILRILVEKQLAVDLRDLLQWAIELHGDKIANPAATLQNVLEYMIERFRAWYEEDGIPVQIFQAVQARSITQPLDFHQRVLAVDAFNRLPEAAALAAANKRVSNILQKSTSAQVPDLDQSLLRDGEEIALAAALAAKATEVAPLFASRDYTAVLTNMASLREPIDDFFDQVMVMTEDASLRNNRLALLQRLRETFLQVADISLLSH